MSKVSATIPTLVGPPSTARLALLLPLLHAHPGEGLRRAVSDNAASVAVRLSAASGVIDWWIAAALGLEIGSAQRYTLHRELPSSALRGFVEATSATTLPPAFAILHARNQCDQLCEEARRLLVYKEHGQLDTTSELATFERLIIPLQVAVERWATTDDEVQPPDWPADRVINGAARIERLEINSPRYEVMCHRLEIAWEAARLAEDARRMARRAVGTRLEAISATPSDDDWNGMAVQLGVDDAEFLGIIRWIVNRVPAGNRTDIAAVLDEEARATLELLEAAWESIDAAVRSRIADLLEPLVWDSDTVKLPAVVTGWAERQAELQSALEALPDSQGGDHDDIGVLILDGELDSAETLLTERRAAGEQSRRLSARRERLLTDLGQLRIDVPADIAILADRVRSAAQSELSENDLDALRDAATDLTRLARQVALAEVEGHVAVLEQRLGQLRAVGAVVSRARALAAAARTDDADRAPAALEDLRVLVEAQYTAQQRALDEAIAALRAAADPLAGLDANTEADLRAVEELRAVGRVADALDLATTSAAAQRRRTAEDWMFEEHGETFLLERIASYIGSRLSVTERDVRRIHVALKTNPFLILAGLTGSGKSSIARLYAEAIGATAANGRFRREAVQPSWVDNTSTIGFYNHLSRLFEPGWLTEVLLACLAAPDLPHIVCLDEMNLAPVEHYFADVLSVMEEARSGGAGDVRLYAAGSRPQNADQFEAALRFPDNLLVIGTINTDESTRAVSARVLDRANLVQLDLTVSHRHHAVSHDFEGPRPVRIRMAEWRKISTVVPDRRPHDLLEELAGILSLAGIGMGMRAHIEVERYVANATAIFGYQEALDAALVQRVIPRIKGTKRQLSNHLDNLRATMHRVGAGRCGRVLDWWLSDEVDDDDFLDGSDQAVGLVISRSQVTYADSVAGPAGAQSSPSDEELDAEVLRIVHEEKPLLKGGGLNMSQVGVLLLRKWPGHDKKRPVASALERLIKEGRITAIDAGVDWATLQPAGALSNAALGRETSVSTRLVHPGAFRESLHASFRLPEWQQKVRIHDEKYGAEFPVLDAWLKAQVQPSWSACGLPSLKVALQYGCTSSGYQVAGGRSETAFHVGVRGKVAKPLPDVTDDDLDRKLVLHPLLSRAGLPIRPTAVISKMVEHLLSVRPSGTMTELKESISGALGLPQADIGAVARCLKTAGVLVTRAGGTPAEEILELGIQAVSAASIEAFTFGAMKAVTAPLPWTVSDATLRGLLYEMD